MIFDGHSDLLYDVTRRRLAGERRVLEQHHLDRLRRGNIEGLVLAVWTSARRRRRFGRRSPVRIPRRPGRSGCSGGRGGMGGMPWLRMVRTSSEAEEAGRPGRCMPFWALRGWKPLGTIPRGLTAMHLWAPAWVH